jgi:hypothetical protein
MVTHCRYEHAGQISLFPTGTPGQPALFSSTSIREVAAVEQPREVHDEEHERVWERVAAIDVAKGSGVVCTRVPDEDRPGRRKTHVHTVPARVNAITELGDYLRARQIQVVTLESTSDYWRIWVRHEAHCCIARSAGGNRRRCFSDLMAYQGPKG